METIISLVQGSLSYAVPMIVLLGLLIFVHELGHFLVAKYNKVRVEVFSLGFGPKLFKFKRGDTVYAISALPLGGYVKMFGDDPTAEISPEDKQGSFLHKTVGQRIAIVLAGPLMNLGFAVILFIGVAVIGEQALLPRLGDISESTSAHDVGFRSGDKIVSVDDMQTKTWDDFQSAIEQSADKSVKVSLIRESGEQTSIEVTPKLAPNKNVLSWSRQVGEVDGLSFSSRAAVVGVRNASTLSSQMGLMTGDLIKAVNGKEMSRWREFREALNAHQSGNVALKIERGILSDDGKTQTVDISIPVPEGTQGADAILQAWGVEYPELYLGSVEKGSPAEKAGLLKGDRLLSINGHSLASFEQVAGEIRSFGDKNIIAKEGEPPTVNPLSVNIERQGQPITMNLVPNMKTRMNPQGQEERRYEIGIRPLILDAPPETTEVSLSNPIEAAGRGLELTGKWTSLTVLSFVRLFQAEVSPKNIGGFLTIGQMAKKSWQIGPSQFLNIMAIISINLFILNLLPVPVLDGGHLVFYTIEALRGAPLSMKKMEIANQVGLFLLLGLMVFALFNDFTRIFS